MEPLVVILRSKRQQRAAAIQKLQHLAPAVILIGAGAGLLTGGHAEGAELALAWLELLSGAAFVFAALKGVRAARRAGAHADSHAHGIEWTDLFAAAVVFAETAERYHRTGHITRPNVLMIATLLVMAFNHGRILGWAEHRRALRVSDEGISVGGRPFRKSLRAAWPDIKAIAVDERRATIETSTWTKRIDLNDMLNAEPARAALELARSRVEQQS